MSYENLLEINTAASTQTAPEISESEIEAIIKKYDAESNFRNLDGITAFIAKAACICLSLFHVYTAGFGLLNEVAHRTVHLSFVLGLVFLIFPRRRNSGKLSSWILGFGFCTLYFFLTWQLTHRLAGQIPPWALYSLFGVIGLISITALPLEKLKGFGDRLSFFDWPLAFAGAGISLYLVIFFKSIFIENIGFPKPAEFIMGLLAIVVVTEATRRTMGETLPVVGALALLYGLLGPYMPDLLAHRGYDIIRIVKHLYLGTEGIYGVAVGVVATYVFHFVLFGVLAQASGLGQLFIDLATMLAGRFVGGPAKISVISSGFFGMISGSPIANTVTTGAFTIPMMKKRGFSSSFAGAVEASSSCGGQVTPPIMGASAFVMSEMLGIPYNELILVAIVPAFFHYLAALLMVHLEAKRLKLEGLSPDEIPSFSVTMKRSWHLMIPLTVMVTLLIMQFTPYLAAFWGIILTVICSYIPLLMKHLGISGLDDTNTLTPDKLIRSLENGARAALAIGSACACVGFILGVITLTGMGFKFSGAVLQVSNSLGHLVSAFVPLNLITAQSGSLFFGLIMVAVACVLMGTGIPTTPTYIILASIAGPAMLDMGVPLLASHFFVFYYGVLADVTPPVALAAYAGAGIARSDPMATGFKAFKLSMGKGLVPFMFVYAPSMLLINFTWAEFSIAMSSGIFGIFLLSVAFTGHFMRRTKKWENLMLCISGLLLVGNYLPFILLGTALGLILIGRIYLTCRK